MKKNKLLSFILTMALLVPASVNGLADEPERTAAQTESGYTSVSERDDFYAAANADVLRKHSVEKTGGAWSWFADMEEKSDQEQKEIIENAAAKPGDQNSSEYKLATLYALAKDQKNRDAVSTSCFNDLMKPLMNAGTIQELMDASAVLQYQYGFDSPLNTEVVLLDETPGEYTAQIDRMNCFFNAKDFADADTEAEFHGYFNKYMSQLLLLSGWKESEKAAEEIYSFMKKIALSSKKEENKEISTDELQKLISNVDISEYFGKIYREVPTKWEINDTASLAELNRYLTDENLSLLKEYVYLINLQKLAPYMTSEMTQTIRELETDYMGGSELDDLEKTIVSQVSSLLSWDVGKIYAEKKFTEEKRNAVNDMVQKIIAEYEQMLREENWLSAETRDKAIEKLKAIRLRIGAPEAIDEYVSAYVPDPGKCYLENVLVLRGMDAKMLYDDYGQPVDRTAWQILPQELIPCYIPIDNSINIPVSVLEAPYFDPAADKEQNLGALGTTIGHEITHAFDELGSKYDKNGDFCDWWTETDRAAFEQRAKKIVAYYDTYVTAGTMKQDGKQTLDENIADLGAINCLTRIVKKQRLSPELFFESYANIWASTADELASAFASVLDDHAADKVRVNAVLSCCELFYQTYHVKSGDGMYVKPENRVGLW